MKTHEDIFNLMCKTEFEYYRLHNCVSDEGCRKCKNHSYCGIDVVELAKLMIFEY